MVGAILGMRIGHEVVGADDECLAFCGTQIPQILRVRGPYTMQRVI